MSYQAIVAKLENVREHPNADRLQLAEVLGASVVVGLEAFTGQIGIYFPSDGKLSEEYCQANNLFPVYNDEGKKIGGGMFDPKNRRVRAQNLRSVRSDGYFADLDSVAYTGINLADLYEGYQFDTLNDHLICEKYYTPQTLRAMKGGTKATRKKIAQFPEHYDTKQFTYEASSIPQGSLVTVTYKLHGTCLVGETPITMFDGSKKKIRDIQVGEYVLGLDKSLNWVKSEVTDVIVQSQVENWIDTKIEPSGSKCDGGGLRLRSTTEHLVYSTDRGYTEAKDLVVGEKVFLAQEYLMPSKDQFSILTGLMLGDGSLSSNSAWAAGVSIGHSVDQFEYLMYTHESLGNVSGSGKLKSRLSGYGSQMYDLTTIYSAFIKDKFDSFYQPTLDRSGKEMRRKIVPSWVADELDDITLAFWYMDDGSLSHSEFQNDRANFATCGFTAEDCETLIEGLKKLGITNVTLYGKDKDVNVHPRLRINWKGQGSDVLFEMIRPYVPTHMHYKLPEKFRSNSWQPPVFSEGERQPYLRESVVTQTNLKPPASFWDPKRSHLRKRYDITTTTHNFFANSILVHNSHRVANVLLDPDPVPWYTSLLDWMRGRTRQPEWTVVHGTRRVVMDANHDERTSYYGTDAFRYKVTKEWEHRLYPGEVVYGEIVGYTDEGGLIMPAPSTKDLKKDEAFKEMFDGKPPSEMKYTYNCLPGETDFYAYRIARADVDGNLVELSWPQVKKRCTELGIKHVPDIEDHWYGLAFTILGDDDRTFLEQLVEKYMGGLDPIDPSHIREGVVVRVDKPSGEVQFLKAKSYYFKVLEGIIKTQDDYVDLEESS